MKRIILQVLVCLLGVQCAQAGQFVLKQLDDRVTVTTDGKLFTEYRYKDRRPCFFPVFDLAGRSMTREWPLNPDSGKPESTDHPHHTGAWFAHGMVWTEGDEKPADYWHLQTMEFRGFQNFEETAEKDMFISRGIWRKENGGINCRDRTTVKFGKDKDGIWIDYEIRIMAPKDTDVILGDTKEGVFGLRVPETMAIETNDKNLRHLSKGNIITSEGVTGQEAWGTRGKWCAYTGEVESAPAVIAIFDHPDNPRHPTWWMARHYGLFAANAFGISFYENKPEGTGNFVIPAGEAITFKWRLLFLNTGFDKQDLENRYTSYTRK